MSETTSPTSEPTARSVPDDAEYLTVDECAALLRRSRKTIDRLIKLGRLPVIDTGTGHQASFLIRRSKLDMYLAVSASRQKRNPARATRKRVHRIVITK